MIDLELKDLRVEGQSVNLLEVDSFYQSSPVPGDVNFSLLIPESFLKWHEIDYNDLISNYKSIIEYIGMLINLKYSKSETKKRFFLNKIIAHKIDSEGVKVEGIASTILKKE